MNITRNEVGLIGKLVDYDYAAEEESYKEIHPNYSGGYHSDKGHIFYAIYRLNKFVNKFGKS